MRLRSLITTILSVALGFIAGVISVQILAPNLLSEQTVVRERLPEAVSAQVVSAGNFRGIDSTRIARGRVQVLDGGNVNLLRFTEFFVNRAPHQQVWLSTASDIRDGGDVPANSVRILGPLKTGKGDQVYLIPEGLDLRDFATVLIWSAEFGVLSAVAELSG